MTSPFPGMDPYLESDGTWPQFHVIFLVEICRQLQPRLVPRYRVSPEQRILIGNSGKERVADAAVLREPRHRSGGAAVAVDASPVVVSPVEVITAPEAFFRHRYLAIRRTDNQVVVTVIELLSPSNKRGHGWTEYRARQRDYLTGDASLVEIDLLRAGRHAIGAPRAYVRPSDYRVCTHRAGSERFHLVRFGVRDPFPNIAIPLADEDPDVVLELGPAAAAAYETSGFGYEIDYEQQPDPPLAPADRAWARELLAAWEPG